MSSHKQIVCSLYKQALNSTKDWIHDRRAYRIYALCIRAAFDRRSSIPTTDTQTIATLIKATRSILLYWKHDSPITYPLSENGVMQGREPQFSQEFLEYGHRQVWGENWQEEMRKYEEGLLYDKKQTYFNTPIIDYSDKKNVNEKEKENKNENEKEKKTDK